MFAFQLWIDGEWVTGSEGQTLAQLATLEAKNAAYGAFPGRRVVKADDDSWVPVDATD